MGMLTGVAKGSTAVAIIFSPFGKSCGAHFNPSVTLTFFRLGKITGWDATFYVLFQFIGSITVNLLRSYPTETARLRFTVK
jgi:aquaporin Z